MQNKLTLEQQSWVGRLLWFCLSNKLVVFLVAIISIGWGIMVAPFDWDVEIVPRRPIPVDAIPDIGENQQIVFTEWMGRSPQDMEDQISYPLTVALLGVPGVKTIRSYSMFGFSTVYVIFKEKVDFYWSRSRILEKLNSLPSGTLPEGVRPALGPDATALGQIYWYTLEGRDPNGRPAGGWDLEELRTTQDWYVRYGLMGAEGVSEVASVGGFAREYQVDVDPDAMRAYGVSYRDVAQAVKAANIDVGAKTLEMNRVEYFIRGVGFIKQASDIEASVVKVTENVPVLVKDVATVTLGPALRRGALDKDGAEAVGGVVVARYGDNPLAVIKQVKKKIAEISPGLPEKALIDFRRVSAEQIRQYAQEHGFNAYSGPIPDGEAWLTHLRSIPESQWPPWATTSKLTLVPFYDRTGLIYETLGTLYHALSEEILITVIVVILMVMHLRSSLLISGLLPIAVLMCFIAMDLFGVDANIVALSGIAIAIGTMVDMGVVICENILRHLDQADPEESKLEVVHRAASEVGGAVLTAVATTVVSFLPVFTMIGAEGKLFKPLAFTKTFALVASVITALTIIPPAAHLLFCSRISGQKLKTALHAVLVALGIIAGLLLEWWVGLVMVVLGAWYLLEPLVPAKLRKLGPWLANFLAVALVAVILSVHWEPLGPQHGTLRNLIFVVGLVALLLGFFRLFQLAYPTILRWCLNHKLIFLCIPALLLIGGGSVWLGFATVWAPVPKAVQALGIDPNRVYQTEFWIKGTERFPGLGKEFMPPLDEGSFLLMPTTMVHASIGEAMDVLSKQDMALRSIPEVDSVVGKIGRAETPLDPAPVSMVETVINYKSEFIEDKDGKRLKFRVDRNTGEFVRDDQGQVIPDPHGHPLRQWRDEIQSPDDIWNEIVRVTKIPGTTSAPKLQPIAARIVMLQSGMRAPMGVKVKGPDLETIEQVGLQIERFIKEVPGVQPEAVLADRIVGKPYLELVPDRQALARYGVSIRAFQDVVEMAVGGMRVTTTVEGRERFAVRVRYQRERRDSIEALTRILVPGAGGVQIPLGQVAEIRYVRGPQVIKSEDTFLLGYVLFDKRPGYAEVDVVEQCQAYLQEKLDAGEFILPAGVSYAFAGSYENQIRSQKTLAVVLPLALFVIFMILYFQFKSVISTGLVFSGILVAWSGGFLMLWLYGQDWFLDFAVFGVNMRELFQIHPINLSVAVWVGFLALFGIASDDGVVINTYLEQVFRNQKIDSVAGIRNATIEAGQRRVRPCLMTTATTILALIPVLTSTGRGSDVMVPMAIPSFGGMAIEVITMLIVPVLYCAVQEWRLKWR
jgi:copper/silver efflux system protein